MQFELLSDPYPSSVNPLEPYQRKKIPGVMVEGDWTDDLARFYADNRIEALYLNVSRGWAGQDYSFLADLHWLRSLNIIAEKCNDLSAISSLSSLEELSLGCPAKKSVNFSLLTRLERCFLEWCNGASSIFDCTGLRSLYIHKLPAKYSGGLANLGDLRELTVYSRSISSLGALSGLDKLKKLELLGVRMLESLSGIENLTSLRSLTLNGCSLLSDLAPLAGLESVEHLVISDWKNIDTLKPVQDLKNLRAFAFTGERTKVLDGDLSPLENLPQLSMLAFASRRHYTHKLIKPWNWGNFYKPDVLLERKRR